MFIIQNAHEIKFNAMQALPPKAMGTGISMWHWGGGVIWIEFCIWRAANDEILMTFGRLRLRGNFDLKVARAT